MKVLKFILKFILLPLFVLPLLAILYFMVANHLYLGSEDTECVAYLKNNKHFISEKGDIIDLDKAFDSSFYANRVFLLTENHGFADAQKADEAMFKNLNKQTGLRFYIAEMDSIRAKRLNQFLGGQTADTTLLRSVVKDIASRIPQQSSVELYKKWLNFYRYNTSLPADKKMEVLGLDQDFGTEDAQTSRDSAMFLTFKRTITNRHLENERFYGLFGFYHGLQAVVTENKRYPFAAKLKRNDWKIGEKVQTIAIFNVKSEMYMPKIEGYPSPPDGKTSWFSMNGPFVLVKGINDLLAVSDEEPLTLFRLDAEKSPYKHSLRLAGVKANLLGDDVLPNNDQQATTNFYQYVLLSNGGKALTAFK